MGPPAPTGADTPVEDNSYSARLAGLMSLPTPTAPNYDDLIKQQYKDAGAMALMQLGAGIAANDLPGGISRAATTGMAGRERAREIDAQGQAALYKSETDNLDRKIEILSKAGLLDVQSEDARQKLAYQAARIEADMAKQGGLNRRNYMNLKERWFRSLMAGVDPNTMEPEAYELLKNQRMLEATVLAGGGQLETGGSNKTLTPEERRAQAATFDRS